MNSPHVAALATQAFPDMPSFVSLQMTLAGTMSVAASFTPDAARDLAAKLIAAANQADENNTTKESKA